MEMNSTKLQRNIDVAPVRIVLVQVSSPEHYALWNALSIEMLAGHIRGIWGKGVKIKLERIQKGSDIGRCIRLLDEFNPDIIGISIELGSLSQTSEFIKRVYDSKQYKNKLPLLILGNKLPTYYPDFFIEQFPSAIIVKGEGEESFAGIVEHLISEKPLKSIPNLTFLSENKTKVVTFEKNPDLKQLIHLPAIDTVPDLAKRGTNALIQASRGCSWSACSFCTLKSFRKGRKWESFPIGKVINNINLLMESGVNEFEFIDDEFFGGRDEYHVLRIFNIADEIEKISAKFKRNITFRIFLIPFVIYQMGDNERNEAILKALFRLKEVGLARVYFGIESGSKAQLKRYNRYRGDYTIQEMEIVIQLFRNRLKIPIDVGFIMFDPYLTIEELIENISFFRKWDLIKANQWPFRPLAINEGSKLYCRMLNSKEGRILLKERNLNFMSYNFKFDDDRVGNIFNIVNSLSKETAGLFYFLKVISKQQFANQKKHIETIKAQQYIEENGIIYLDLMEQLALDINIDTVYNIIEAVGRARRRIHNIIVKINKDIYDGFYGKDVENITSQINAYYNKSKKKIRLSLIEAPILSP